MGQRLCPAMKGKAAQGCSQRNQTVGGDAKLAQHPHDLHKKEHPGLLLYILGRSWQLLSWRSADVTNIMEERLHQSQPHSQKPSILNETRLLAFQQAFAEKSRHRQLRNCILASNEAETMLAWALSTSTYDPHMHILHMHI